MTNRIKSSTIPPEFGQFPALQTLDLSRSRLRGTVPPQLFQLPLLSLNLQHNSLSGTIPTTLGAQQLLLFPQQGSSFLCPVPDYSDLAQNDYANATCSGFIESFIFFFDFSFFF
jgi:hypothetical protein